MTERKTYENPQQLRQERKALISDTIRQQKKPARTPIMSHAWTWKPIDAGYTLKECLYDYEKMYDAVCTHHEKYEMDFYIDMGSRNPVQVTDCFGESLYVIDEDDHLSIKDYALMDADDYDDLIQGGLIKYYFEKGVPFRYGITDKETMKAGYAKAANEYMHLADYNKRIASQYVNEYGVPNFCAGKPTNPMDTMMCALRGIKGLSNDMRRQPEKLKEALAVLDSYWNKGTLKTLETFDDNDTVAMSFRMTTLSHTIQNPKQFEQFSWPYIERYAKQVSERNWIAWLFTEGSISHVTDFFADIPKGAIGLLLEQDDPIAMKKTLPNVTIAGGFPVTTLQNCSVSENIDRAKEIIDAMAYDGNYIFTTDKMMSFPEDGKGENLKAVVDFVKEYARF